MTYGSKRTVSTIRPIESNFKFEQSDGHTIPFQLLG
jgi:hypothetical protein